MNKDWKALLESFAAHIDERGEVIFPDAPAEPDCALFDCSHLGSIALSGEDARQFLQGQVTNDVRELSARHSQLSSHCNPKGRMIASFRVIQRGEAILLQLPAESLQPLLKRLRMFVLRSRVSLEDVSDKLVCIGIAGACAQGLLSSRFSEVPALDNQAVEDEGMILVRIPAPVPRFEILGPAGDLVTLWRELAETAVPANRADWKLLDIRAGIPTIYPQTAELFVPQMANMQLLDGLSFTKGCYTGQEVVARMQYLGKLKRRMYLAAIETGAQPAPGQELFSSHSASGQGTGRIVEAQATADGHCEALAVIEIAAAEQGEVCLGKDGPRLRLKDLPYPFSHDDSRPAS